MMIVRTPGGKRQVWKLRLCVENTMGEVKRSIRFERSFLKRLCLNQTILLKRATV